MTVRQPISRHHEVDYDDPSHRYFLGADVYTSATQLLDQFKRKFDADSEAKRMAATWGHTEEYWLNKWGHETDKSHVRGNALHDKKEQLDYGRGVGVIDGETYWVQNRALFEDHVEYLRLPDGIYPELKLWRHDARIAGRSDRVILRTQEASYQHSHLSMRRLLAVQRVADIEDYKTNKKIRTEGWQWNFELKQWEKAYMKGPLAHIEDCELNHYALQLSIYQYMLEYHGFVPGRRRIIHFGHDVMGLGEPSPKVYELPYLRDEVVAMLRYLGREAA